MTDPQTLMGMDEPAHNEHHKIHRSNWLRAAVLGANDGIISTASLVVGVSAAAASTNTIVITGIAALVAGSLSMAAGEYVSVQSQADIENADLEMERLALIQHPEQELAELAQIYVARGLSPELAAKVATQLTEADALGAHARDELGITDMGKAKPLQAALTSAVSFAAGALMPILGAVLAPTGNVTRTVAIISILSLILLGYFSARAGGAHKQRAILRVVFWGLIAMGITGLIGKYVGTIL